MLKKISELKGARNLVRIECKCGDTWIRYGNKAFDNRERRKFLAKHADHDLGGFQVTSTVRKR